MKEFKNIKVFSVCDVFQGKYEHLYESITECTSPDSYIHYTITDGEEQTEALREYYGEELKAGELILIEIDY